MKQYRTNGAVGALLDEYEKAIRELILVTDGLSAAQLVQVVDTETSDEDCRSIQTILTHVVSSGLVYAIEIRKSLGEQIEYPLKNPRNIPNEYHTDLLEMLRQTELVFSDYPTISITESNPNKKIKVRWGQYYDVEQLMEHAIVHVLRHRRQIERFKLLLNI